MLGRRVSLYTFTSCAERIKGATWKRELLNVFTQLIIKLLHYAIDGALQLL